MRQLPHCSRSHRSLGFDFYGECELRLTFLDALPIERIGIWLAETVLQALLVARLVAYWRLRSCQRHCYAVYANLGTAGGARQQVHKNVYETSLLQFCLEQRLNFTVVVGTLLYRHGDLLSSMRR